MSTNDDNDFDDLLSLTNDDETTPAPAEETAEVPEEKTEVPEETTVPEIEPEQYSDESAAAAPVEKPKRTRAPRKPKDPEMTPDQKRIVELEAKLAALDEAQTVAEPELTPEQKRIKELEALLAEREGGSNDLDAFTDPTTPDDPNLVVFHFLIDGTVAFGQVWHKGQVIRIRRDSADWKRSLNRNGISWIDRFLDDPNAQFEKWGEVRIGRGEYRWMPGEEFDVIVAREDVRRNGRVPVSATTE